MNKNLYSVLSERQAEKDLKNIQKINIKLFDTICAVINKLKVNPKLFGSHKLSGGSNYYRIRIGNHRVVYEINEKDKTVLLYRIRHRKDIYKNL